jgi:hypothetical protein
LSKFETRTFDYIHLKTVKFVISFVFHLGIYGAKHLGFKNKLRYGCGTGPADAVRSKSKCL